METKFTTRAKAEITSIPTILNTSYLRSLDGLRGIAIIFVLLSHTWRDQFGPLGLVGVEIFFVISGFLITTLLIKEKVLSGTISLRKFYIRRVIRIVPATYLFILVLFFLNIIFQLKISLTSFATSLFYLKNIPIPNGWEHYSAHLWSLSVEEQFYLLFPFLLAHNLTKYFAFTTIFIFFITTIAFVAEHRIGIFYSNYIIHGITFMLNAVLFGRGTVYILIGSLFSMLLFKKIIVAENIYNGYFFSFGVFVLALLIRIFTPNIFIASLIKFSFPFLIALVIILSLRSENTFLSDILNNGVLKRIGVLSYSIYIWQQLFTVHQPWHNLYPPYTNSILLNLLLLSFVAYSSYYFYEKRFLLLKNRFM